MKMQFDTNVTKECGLPAAVVFEVITSLACRKEDYHDGRYWVRASVATLHGCLLHCISERQIRTALDKLVSAGLLLTGSYSDSEFDRAKWYALTDKGVAVKNG